MRRCSPWPARRRTCCPLCGRDPGRCGVREPGRAGCGVGLVRGTGPARAGTGPATSAQRLAASKPLRGRPVDPGGRADDAAGDGAGRVDVTESLGRRPERRLQVVRVPGRRPQGERDRVVRADPLSVAQQTGRLPGFGGEGYVRGPAQPCAYEPFGVRSATAARVNSPRTESAAATATATAPAMPSGCAWVTAACSAACSAASPMSWWKRAPSGATRIAAPLPRLPPSKSSGPGCASRPAGSAVRAAGRASRGRSRGPGPPRRRARNRARGGPARPGRARRGRVAGRGRARCRRSRARPAPRGAACLDLVERPAGLAEEREPPLTERIAQGQPFEAAAGGCGACGKGRGRSRHARHTPRTDRRHTSVPSRRPTAYVPSGARREPFPPSPHSPDVPWAMASSTSATLARSSASKRSLSSCSAISSSWAMSRSRLESPSSKTPMST